MDSPGPQAGDDAAVAEHDALDGIVVGQHGHDGVAAAGARHVGRSFRALRDERFSLRAGPVVDGHIVTGFQQVCRHAGAHAPQSDESDFHFLASLQPPSLMVCGEDYATVWRTALPPLPPLFASCGYRMGSDRAAIDLDAHRAACLDRVRVSAR